MKKLLSITLALVMMATVMVGCNTTTPGADDATEITIGLLAPLTGEVAQYGTAVKNAVELAFEKINAEGGLLGKQVKLEILDEKGNPDEAVNAYNLLMSKNIVALLGDVTSKPTLAIASLAANDRIPMLTPTATHPDVTTYGDNIFRACFLDPFQGSVMATYASGNLSAKTAAVIYNTSDDYSTGLAESFKATAEAKGMTIVSYEGYGANDKDFKTQLTNIRAANPDVLFMPDYYGTVALIVTQAREVGYTNVCLGVDGWDGILDSIDPAKLSDLNNTYFCNHYSVDDESEVVQTFINDYTTKYNQAPSALGALGYDGAFIMADAIKRAGKTDKEAIIAALKTTNYDGVTGNISYGENGDPIKSTAILKFDGTAFKLETKVAP